MQKLMTAAAFMVKLLAFCQQEVRLHLYDC